METDIENLLKKCYNTFQLGKKTFETNKEESCEYIKSSLILLDKIRQYPKKDVEKYSDILNETENESCKLLNLCLEYTIETEIPTEKNEIDYIKIFKTIEKGDLNEIKKYNINEINFKKLYKNQTILHYAIKFGDTQFIKHCLKLGARIDTPNGVGNSLLEYACLEKDQNIINFLLKNGANMKKHLYFRNSKIKNVNYNDSIDISNLCKFVLELREPTPYSNQDIINIQINEIKKYLNIDELVGSNEYTINNLLNNIEYLLNNFDKNSAETYFNIINEEIKFTLKNKLGCPHNKLEIILVNLVPFINYPFYLEIDWILSLELKYIIIKNIKNKKLVELNEIKKNIVDEIWEKYIKTEIIPEDYLGTIISQWMTKIKV